MSTSGESQTTIKENVSYFMDHIMNAARTKSNWSTESLRQAFKWAAYCAHFSAQPALGPVLSHILKTRGFPENPVLFEKSEERLALELLLNQKITGNCKETVHSLIRDILGRETLEKLIRRQSIVQENHQAVVESLSSTESLKPIWETVKIRFLVKSVEVTCDWKQLNALLLSPGIIPMLLGMSTTLESLEKEAFLRTLGKWLNSQLILEDPNSKLIKEFVAICSKDLCKLCSLYENFHQTLLSAIEKLGKLISLGRESDITEEDILAVINKLRQPDLEKVTSAAIERWLQSEHKCFWLTLLINEDL